MTKKDKLYIGGAIVCFLAVCGIIFFTIKSNKTATNEQAMAETQNATQAVENQATENLSDVGRPSDATRTDAAARQGDGKNAPSDGTDGGRQRGPIENIPEGSKAFFGEVSAISESKITLKSRNNESVIVILSDSTEYAGGTQDEIVTGSKLAGYGTSDSDGNITASKITINPSFPGGGKPGQSPNN